MEKRELREIYLKKRAALSAAEVASASRLIADRFFLSVDLTAVRTVHTFIRIDKFTEIDTSMIYYRLWRDHPNIRTAAPRTDLQTGDIDSVIFDARTELTENSWGIREPENGETVEPHDIDLVLVPLLCFDNSGHRVGYGRGMYDRFLAGCRPDCVKVGVSLFPPVEEIEGVNSSDVALDLCVTPDEVFEFNETTRSVPPMLAAPSRQ